MKAYPNNMPLAVIWRLLLLTATVVIILAVGMHQFEWQPFGEKQMPTAPDDVEQVIRQDMGGEDTPQPWDEPLEKIKGLLQTDEDTPEVTPTPTPTPKPTPTPTPTPTPEPKMDEDALTGFLEDQLK
ncbi:MAG: hypothetical protein P9L99_13815 [Candidatus Lernaella stagnicola]|nr:hypothetical protein [Candidatus Lernaella stagnicola]